MSSIARKGLSATLLVFVLAAPVAAAAPMEWSEGPEGAAAAGWVSELVERVGGWLLLRRGADRPGQTSEDEKGEIRSLGAADGNDGGGGGDPNG
jgi:hypothetical protein